MRFYNAAGTAGYASSTSPNALLSGSSHGSNGFQASVPSRKIGRRTCSELAVLTAAAVPLLALLAVNYARGSATTRRTDRTFALLLLLLTAFAAGIDLVDAAFPTSSLPLLEDGGELVVLSLITSYAYSLTNYDATQ